MNIKDDTIQYFLKIITLVLGILLLFNIVYAIGYFVNEHRNAHPGEMKVKVDTLFVYDTIFVEKPVIKKVEIIDTLRLPVPITDTLMLHDTVLVHLPIEQRQYSDPRYTAWVSGYRPDLSCTIYRRGTLLLYHQLVIQDLREAIYNLGEKDGEIKTTEVTKNMFIKC